MKNNLIKARTCVYNVNYHMVWSVKYRKKVLTKGIEDRLREIAKEVSSYYVETIGSVSEENIRRYIENQSNPSEEGR